MNAKEKGKFLWKRTTERLPAIGIGDITPTIIAIGTAGVIGAVILLVLFNIQQLPTNYSCSPSNLGLPCSTTPSNPNFVNSIRLASANALVNGTASLGNIYAQLPLLGTVIGLMLVLGVVLYFFYKKGASGGGI